MSAILVSPVAGVLSFDAVPRVGYQPESLVTEHPIEDAGSIIDHIQVLPLRMSIEGVVSETPWGFAPDSAISDPIGTAIDWFEVSAKSLVTVIAKGRTYPNMVVTSYAHDDTKIREARFFISLMQVEIATVSTVDIPPDAPSSASGQSGFPDQQDVNQQAVTEVDADGAQATANRSAMATIADFLGGR